MLCPLNVNVPRAHEELGPVNMSVRIESPAKSPHNFKLESDNVGFLEQTLQVQYALVFLNLGSQTYRCES